MQVAVTILNGDGFSYSVPSRAKGNQLYVPELDRIVLKVHTYHHSPCQLSSPDRAEYLMPAAFHLQHSDVRMESVAWQTRLNQGYVEP